MGMVGEGMGQQIIRLFEGRIAPSIRSTRSVCCRLWFLPPSDRRAYADATMSANATPHGSQSTKNPNTIG
jgi:hypothetical protein